LRSTFRSPEVPRACATVRDLMDKRRREKGAAKAGTTSTGKAGGNRNAGKAGAQRRHVRRSRSPLRVAQSLTSSSVWHLSASGKRDAAAGVATSVATSTRREVGGGGGADEASRRTSRRATSAGARSGTRAGARPSLASLARAFPGSPLARPLARVRTATGRRTTRKTRGGAKGSVKTKKGVSVSKHSGVDAASRWYEAALTVLARDHSPGHPLVLSARRRVAQFYLQIGHVDRAMGELDTIAAVVAAPRGHVKGGSGSGGSEGSEVHGGRGARSEEGGVAGEVAGVA
jgi:hypothetical protein